MTTLGDITTPLPGFSIVGRPSLFNGGPEEWVGCTNPPSVVRINALTGKSTATIPCGTAGVNQLNGLCITPDKVWFSDMIAGRAGWIDPATNTVTYPPALSGLVTPLRGMSYCPATNRVLLIGGGAVGVAYIIDNATCALLHTVSIGHTPFYPDCDRMGFGWAPCFGSAQVSVLNMATGAIVNTINTQANPWGVRCAGRRTYVSELGTSSVASYATTHFNGLGGASWSKRFYCDANAGLHDIALLPNGSIAATQSNLSNLILMDGESGRIIDRYFTQYPPTGTSDPATCWFNPSTGDLACVAALIPNVSRFRAAFPAL